MFAGTEPITMRRNYLTYLGHWHRNSYGKYKNMEMVTTSALGMPLGSDLEGLRIVKVFHDSISHTYYPLDQVPKECNLNH